MFGDNYNEISCSVITRPITRNCTYTSGQLKQLSNNQSASRRIRKILIERQIWKPTGYSRKKPTTCAKFALVNAPSVRNRTALFLNDYVTANHIDIICIRETWLTQLHVVYISVLEGKNYTLSHIVRDNG